MFENSGHMHKDSPGAGTDNTLGSKYFHKHESFVNLIICCKLFPINDRVTVFPIQTNRRANLALL